jgi:hypothetical protein
MHIGIASEAMDNIRGTFDVAQITAIDPRK